MATKTIGLFLALILTALSLVLSGCGSALDGPAGETVPETGLPASSETGPESETAEPRILPDLPDLTFQSDEIHCLHWTLGSDGVGSGWIPWEEIAADRYNGDSVNDAVYERNHYVEEKYHVVVTTEYAQANTELPDKVLQAVATGDNTYSFIVERSLDIRSMWTSGSFYNLNGDELQYLDLEKPWWNRDSLDAFTFGGVTQFASSDLLVMDKSETGVVLFSTVLQADNKLDNYYELVENGTWTWEALARNAEACEDDLDGDLTMTARDQWGSCGNRAPGEYLYVGSGRKFAEIDKDGYIYTQVGDEESIDLMQEIHEMMIYPSFHAHTDYIKEFSITNKFKANEVEFLYYSVKMANSLRDMETNYGILPIPKYDEHQTRYYDLVMPDGDSILAVPISNDTPEVTGFVLEALTAESYYTVYPAFFDVVMMGKCTRDPESRDMLGIIFNSRTYDTGLVQGLGGFMNEYVLYAQMHHGDVAFTSLYKTYESKIGDSLEKINRLIDNWNAE